VFDKHVAGTCQNDAQEDKSEGEFEPGWVGESNHESEQKTEEAEKSEEVANPLHKAGSLAEGRGGVKADGAQYALSSCAVQRGAIDSGCMMGASQESVADPDKYAGSSVVIDGRQSCETTETCSGDVGLTSVTTARRRDASSHERMSPQSAVLARAAHV
jgi:hypothetical protein